MILVQLREKAKRAHSGTSFSPEKRADSLIKCYSEELEDDLKNLGDNQGNYKQKYIDKLSVWLDRKSRCLSPMITGPSNFPVSRNMKANNSEHNAYEDFRNWRSKYFKAVNRVPAPSPEEDLDNAVEDLDKLIISQQKMKSANKILRSKSKIKLCELLEAGWDIKSAEKLIKEKFNFPSYSLTNNNAKIKARTDKILIMKSRIKVKESFEPIKFEGGYIDIQEDRVVIFHDDKPSDEIIDKIKAKGFRWSRKFNCWCRKHTANAIYDAKNIMGVN